MFNRQNFTLFFLGLIWMRISLSHSSSKGTRTYDGSGPEFNVFYPRSCIGAECSLGVKWDEWVDTNWINFTLMAKTRGDGFWAAVGFSENGRMSDSDVVTCWYDKNNNYKVYNAWNSDVRRKCIIDSNQDIVQPFGGNYTDGLFTCSFGRLKTLNDTSNKKDKSLDTKWHILLAWGPLSPSSGSAPSIMLQHAKQYTTVCTCNVTNSSELCLCIDEFKHLLLKLHGAVMSVVFILIFPTGAFIAAFYQKIIADNWFQSHRILMVSGTIGMVAGLGLILGHTGGSFRVGPHQIIGCVTMGFVVVQVAIAMFRPAKESPYRKLFVICHYGNARFVLLLGYLSMALGSWLLYRDKERIFLWMVNILVISFVCSVSFVFIMIIINKFQSCKERSLPVRYHKVSEDSNAEEEISVKDDSNVSFQHTRERTLLIGFILQSFTLAGLICAFVFYTESQGH